MKLLSFIIFSFLIQTTSMSQTEATLIYVGDPMCSWCYGVAPELNKVVDQLGEGVEFQLLMGGLRPYNTQTVKELGSFLKEHWEHVAEKSGQLFSYGILENVNILYDTEPPSRAVLVVRKMKPEKEYAFFKAVQKTFYVDNQDMNQVATYLPLIEAIGIDAEEFSTAFNSEEMKAAVRRDFEVAAEMGVRGFPTIILKKGEQYHLIANGYARSETMLATLKELLSTN